MQEKKIRLFFDDPEATDSSSDERAESTRQKLVTYEIVKNPNKTLKQARVRRPRSATSSPSSSKRGVRMRKWGKWAAEIRDPMRGVRLWLGTFDTQDEASVAYETARVRLQAEKKAAGFPASVLDDPPQPPLPPQPAATKEPPPLVAEIFAMSHPVTPELDFKLDMESFLMGDFVEDFMGLGDLPLLGHHHHQQHQFDNGDFSWAAADIFAA